ncbi:MAG: T9SS type A sorting domain-containing protein [Balneolaceae bacterium]|nr:T9SS type A sorting domain-containing protein [Balneolaceae bacterium]
MVHKRGCVGYGKGITCFITILLLTVLTAEVYAQSSATPPNVYSPLILDTYPGVTVTTASTPLLTSFSDANNVINDVDDFATYSYAVTGTGSLRVTDSNATADPHPGGSYAGFVVDNTILDIEIIGSTTVTTYLDGDVQESVDATDLLTLGLLGDRAKVGFVTEDPFDAIEISYSALGLTGSKVIYYAEVLTPDNDATPNLEDFCNEPLAWVQAPLDESAAGFPVVIENERTGGSGITLGDIAGLDNVVNNDTDDFASMVSVLGLASEVSLSVRTLGDALPGGTYAGFNVSIDELLSVGILDEITITTYLDGDEQESVDGDNLLASVGLLGSSDRYNIGFQTTQDFDEIQITLEDGLLSLDLSVFNVYHAVVQNFCAGAALECQTQTPISTPVYPVFINAVNTGVSGAVSACLLSDCIQDMENLINGNPNEGAVITQLASSGSANISVKFGEGSFASGSEPVFVGFDVENTALLDVDVIEGITITTYMDGSEVESSSDGGNTLVEANTDLITGNERRTVGFAATNEFNEVQLSIENVLGVSLDETTVYQLFLRELCPGPFVPCGETANLEQDTYPVIINSERTGFFGAACVGCSVENADAVISADDNDFATITSTVDLLNYASISVLNPVDTYPANSTAGFTIDTNTSNLVELDLFEALEICTYNNGSEQECRRGSNLLSLTALIPLIGPGGGVFNVGFVTSQPYDEIVLRAGDLASANVLDGTIDVYNAFVDYSTVDSDGDSCPPIDITLDNNPCYRMLSPPVLGLTYGDMLDGLWTQGAIGSDYPDGPPHIFTWPVTEPGDDETGWLELPDLGEEIPTGSGFLVSVFEDDIYGEPGNFPKTISIAPGPQPGPFTQSGAVMNQNPGGWTLLGNPFQFNIDVTQLGTNDLTGAFYVYDVNAGGDTNGIPGGWVSNAAGFGDLVDNAVVVGQGFFVQTDGSDPSVTFSDASRTEDGVFYGKEKERRDFVRLELRGEGVYNSAWIRFSDEGSFDQVYGDALQLYPFQEEYAVLSSEKPEYGLLDIGHYPLPNHEEEVKIPLYADVSVSGSFTISATDLDLPATMNLFLKDVKTGIITEIDDQMEYTFTISQAGKQMSPDQGLECSMGLVQAKAAEAQPRFIITNNIVVENSDMPSEIALSQNYPNPFNPTTVINYHLPSNMEVTLQVFDMTGRRVAILEEGTMPAGTHTVIFDGSNLSSGVYIYTLQAGQQVISKKLTLIK